MLKSQDNHRYPAKTTRWNGLVGFARDNSGQYTNAGPSNKDDMKHRMTRIIQLQDGFLNDMELIHDNNNDQSCNIFFDVLPDVAPLVRRVYFRKSLFCWGRKHMEAMAQFFQNASRLSSIEIRGGTGQHFTFIVEALAKNPDVPVSRMVLSCVSGNASAKIAVLKAFERLTNLREIRIENCFESVVQRLSRGLRSHQKMEIVAMNDISRSIKNVRIEAIGELVASLPNLQSFENRHEQGFIMPYLNGALKHVTKLKLLESIPPGDSVRGLIQALGSASQLREVEIYPPSYSESPVDARKICEAVTKLPNLEYLSTTTQSVEWILQCRSLKRLTCRFLCPEHVETLIELQVSLESLELKSIDYKTCLKILHLMESNERIRELKLWYQIDDEIEISDQLINTLKTNETLKSLAIVPSKSSVLVLSEILQSNSCSLMSLFLDNILFDPVNLVTALASNASLTSLFLKWNFKVDPVNTWVSLVQMLPGFAILKHLELDMPGARGNATEQIREFATALERNTTLTEVRVCKRLAHQIQWDFICRLYTRRNRIKQMVDSDPLSRKLWPLVLQTLTPNPSALFLVSDSILLEGKSD